MTRYLAALRDGQGLVWMGECGRWLPASAFTCRSGLKVRQFRYAASAIEIADHFAQKAGCGWRVEMVRDSASPRGWPSRDPS